PRAPNATPAPGQSAAFPTASAEHRSPARSAEASAYAREPDRKRTRLSARPRTGPQKDTPQRAPANRTARGHASALAALLALAVLALLGRALLLTRLARTPQLGRGAHRHRPEPPPGEEALDQLGL